jgi:chemosensory pili system protein ChpC
MSDLNAAVRSLLIPLTNDTLLLPNASLAEIVNFSDPVPVEDSPEWFLGLLSWRGLQVPLISFETLKGESTGDQAKKLRIAILNAPSGNDALPFYGMVVQGIPHLIMASQSIVSSLSEQDEEVGVLAHVLVEAEPAIIPDLEGLESMLLDNSLNVA